MNPNATQKNAVQLSRDRRRGLYRGIMIEFSNGVENPVAARSVYGRLGEVHQVWGSAQELLTESQAGDRPAADGELVRHVRRMLSVVSLATRRFSEITSGGCTGRPQWVVGCCRGAAPAPPAAAATAVAVSTRSRCGGFGWS